MKKIILTMVVAMQVSGCAPMLIGAIVRANEPQKTVTAAAFDEAQYAPYRLLGTSGLKGQLYAVTRGGDGKLVAGKYVMLYPATDYGRKNKMCWVSEDPCTVVAADEALHRKFTRITQADASGKFEFPKLPAGKYVIMANFTWEVPGPYGMRTTGGPVAEEVELQPGEDQTVQLKL